MAISGQPLMANLFIAPNDTLTPPFDPETFAYTARVPAYDKISLIGEAESCQYLVGTLKPDHDKEGTHWFLEETFVPEEYVRSLGVHVYDPATKLESEYKVDFVLEEGYDPGILKAVEGSPVLEPSFSPHMYTYYAYVSFPSVYLKFTAVHPECRILINGEEAGVGEATYYGVFNPLVEDTRTVRVTTVSESEVDNTTYVFVLLENVDTKLKDLSVLGATLKPDFDPAVYRYTARTDKGARFVAFKASPESWVSTVYIKEGEDHPHGGTLVPYSTGRSEWYEIKLGQRTHYTIYVLQAGMVVPRWYDVVVHRPAKWYASHEWARRFANMIGWTSFIVSSVGGAGFISNTKFLHFISMTNALHGNPETWNDFSDSFNKFNMQFHFEGVKVNDTTDIDPEDVLDFQMKPMPLIQGGGMPSVRKLNSHFSFSLSDSDILEFEQIARNLESSPGEKEELMDQIAVRAKNRAKVTQWMGSIYIATYVLTGGAGLYSLAWMFYLRDRESGSYVHIRRDFPTVLHPGRIWVFLFDFGLISYTQAAAGIMFLDDPTLNIDVFGHVVSMQALYIWCFITLIGYPIFFVLAMAAILFYIRPHMVYCELLGRWNDQKVREIKARNGILQGVPIIKNLLRMEIRNTVPVVKPADDGYIEFGEPPDLSAGRISWPWLVSDPAEVDLEGEVTEAIKKDEERKRRLSLKTESPRTATPPPNTRSTTTDPDFNPDQMYHVSTPTKAAEVSEIEMPLINKDAARRIQTLEDDDVSEVSDLVFEKLQGGGDLRYDPDTEEVEVDFDEQAYMGENYDTKNAKIYKKYPTFILGYNTHHVKNPYNNTVSARLEVQIQHVVPLMQMMDFYTLWTPVEQLQLPYYDRYRGLLEEAPRGRFFAFVADRTATIMIILGVISYKSGDGAMQACVFAVVCALLGASHLGSAFMTGLAHWKEEMKRILMERKTTEKREENLLENRKIWPFDNPIVYNNFVEMQRFKESLYWCGLYGYYRRFIREPWNNLWHAEWTKTRLAYTAKEVIFGPVLTEMLKFMILMALFFAHSSIRVFDNASGSFTAILTCMVAILISNINSVRKFSTQFIAMMQSILRYVVVGAYIIAEFISGLPRFILTSKLYVKGVMKWVRDGGVDPFPRQFPEPTLASAQRQLKIKTLSMVTSELGLKFDADVRLHGNSERNLPPEEKERYQWHKTLIRTGNIGAVRELEKRHPLNISFTKFYHGKRASHTRHVGTIQVINHTETRYGKVAHRLGEDHDSYYSIFVDDDLIPPPGEINSPDSHGYAVRYDGYEHQLIVEGPKIRLGDMLRITPRMDLQPDNPYRNRMAATAVGGDHVGDEIATAVVKHSGTVTVTIPRGSVPSLHHPIKIDCPNGKTTFIDPKEIRVIVDDHAGELHVRSRYLIRNETPYTFTWTVKPPPKDLEPLKGRGVRHGKAHFKLGGASRDGVPRMTTPFELHFPDDSIRLIDPIDTDAHYFTMPVPELKGVVRFLTLLWRNIVSVLFTVLGIIVDADDPEEPVPCTLVQCVDPDNLKYRLLPNFWPAIREVEARMEENEAKRLALTEEPEELVHICLSVMSHSEYIFFWVSNGADILHEARWLNPLAEREHKKIAAMAPKIDKIEHKLRNKVEKILLRHQSTLEKRRSQLMKWRDAYEDPDLILAQEELDEAFWTATQVVDVRSQVNRLRRLKKNHSKLHNFIYPMNIVASDIQIMPKLAMQYRSWETELRRWLFDELNASDDAAKHAGGDSYATFILEEIMKATKRVFLRPENVVTDTYRSALHFVCNSAFVCGRRCKWRPDPLASHSAVVRIFKEGEDGQPDPNKPYWIQCTVKLCGNRLKIMTPSKSDTEREFPTNYSFKSVTGWYVPFKALEKFELSENTRLPSEIASNALLKDFVCKLSMTPNLAAGNKQYIRRIDSDKVDNLVEIEPNGVPARYRLVTGIRVEHYQARYYPDAVPDTQGEMYFARHLELRFPKSVEKAWKTVIEATQLDMQPPWLGADVSDDEEELTLNIDDPIDESFHSPIDTLPSHLSSDVSDSLEPAPLFQGKLIKPVLEGKGAQYDRVGELVYDGQWKAGMRWGTGTVMLKDQTGASYVATGQFIQDEMDGPFEIRLVEEVQESDEMWKIVSINTRVERRNFDRRTTFPLVAKNDAGTIPVDQLQSLLESRASVMMEDNDELIMDVRRVATDPSDPRPLKTKTGYLDEYPPTKVKWAKQVDQNFDLWNFFDSIKGPGEATYANGASYTGNFENGHPEGEGALTLAGYKYHGAFIQGKPEGKGKLYDEKEGIVFEGTFKNGLRHGEGVLTSHNGGVVIRGEWIEDVPQSVVVEVSDQVDDPTCQFKRYEGSTHNGVPHGVGKMDFGTDVMFEGNFDKGERCGNGRATRGNGKNKIIYYNGDWLADKPHGNCARLVLPDGTIYQGHVKEGLRHGLGFQARPGGKIHYQGMWKDNKAHGHGMSWQNDGEYCGMFRDGYAHGQGRFVYKNDLRPGARQYVGSWKEGKFHGTGKLILEGNKSYALTFEDGVVSDESLQAYQGSCSSLSIKPEDLKIEPVYIEAYEGQEHQWRERKPTSRSSPTPGWVASDFASTITSRIGLTQRAEAFNPDILRRAGTPNRRTSIVMDPATPRKSKRSPHKRISNRTPRRQVSVAVERQRRASITPRGV